MDIGYYQAPTFISREEFDDNYFRTFQAEKIPELSKEEMDLIKPWIEDAKLEEIMLYLTGEKYRNLSQDMAEFMLRELLRGNMWA